MTFIVVFYAKMRAEVPGDAVLLNAASAEKLAGVLGIDSDIAARLADARTRLGGFRSVDELMDVPLFAPDEADRIAAKAAGAHLDLLTASAAQIAAGLDLPPALAHRFVAYRVSLLPPPVQNGQASPLPPDILRQPPAQLLRHASLLDPHGVRSVMSRFLIRTPSEVTRQFWTHALLLLILAFFLPVWLRGARWRVGGDPFLVPLALLLSGLGVVLLFSIKDPWRDQAAYTHHAQGLLLAVIALIVSARLTPAARLRIKNYQYVWVLAAMLLVVGLYTFGHGPEGVKLNLLGFQPVEIIKLLLVFFLAGYLSSRASLIADLSSRRLPQRPDANGGAASAARTTSLPRLQDVGPVAVMFAFALTLFYVVKDLGPGVLLFAVFISVLYLTTGRAGFVWTGLALLVIGGFLGYRLHIGVFATRADMWLSPFDNKHPTGMQLGQALWGMASGGAEGSGLGLGMPGLIPRSGSDMAFASWAEETGLLGSWMVLAIYAVLVWRGLRIALHAGNDFDRALAFGLTTLLGLQTLFILGGVTGALPLAGLALPFLSWGDSALIASFVCIGLLRGISVPPSGGVGRPEARRETVTATRWFGLAYTFLLLGGIGLLRLGSLLLLHANEIAVRSITTPDADHISRPHLNPRLLAMERQIERGSIYDRNGRVLATSRPAEIAKLVSNRAEAQRLTETRARFYPFGPAAAHLVGYLDPAVGGPFGFEKGYNAGLRGFQHHADLLADYRNRNLPGFRPRRGRDLHLTLDAVLQRDAQNLLWQTAGSLRDTRTHRPKDRAAFVLLDTQTGDVLVAATIPTFDPNLLTPEQVRRFVVGPDAEAEHRFINRAVYGVYPPGSTLKVATAATALDNLPNAMQFSVVCNRVDPNVRWQAHGVTYARTIHDDVGDPSFGPLTLAPAFRVSSNIYFANLATQIGATTFRTTLADKMRFRFTPPQLRFDRDLADIGYGQGRMLASPLEMARLAAAVAKNGTMMQPRFVTSLTDPAGRDKKRAFPPTTLSQAMAAPTAATLRTLMRSVVTGGTASGVFGDLRVPIAGKTGTAQNTQNDRQPHSWFIGFAPYSETSAPPRYAFACLVENGGYGKRVAAVVCHKMLQHLF